MMIGTYNGCGICLILLVSCTETKDLDSASSSDIEEEYVDTTVLAKQHLDAFSEIAEQNSGNRTTGSSGYDASVLYVEEQLIAFGYEVMKQEFFVPTFFIDSPSVMKFGEEVLNPEQFLPLTYSPPGTGEGVLQSVDTLIPPQEANSSNSGCQIEDFEDFVPGAVALIQRGTCTFTKKAQNAQEAGAVAVIIFNEGQNGRTGVVEGTLGTTEIQIPVVGTSHNMGLTLLDREGEVISFEVYTQLENLPSYNVIAERKGNSGVLMVGAHLDSVPEGPGINDNASGSASILAVAQRLSDEGFTGDKHIRFAFWGAEELGLLGSYHYTEGLSGSGVQEIAAYLNFDMVGSPNFIRMVYDGDGSESSMSGPPGSGFIEDIFKDVLRENDFSFTETFFDGRSDYAGFIALDIPSGGLFSGAEGIMSNLQANNFEGIQGESYDPCYHRDCDTRENVNEEGFSSMVVVTEEVIRRLAEQEVLSVQRVRLPESLVFEETENSHHSSGCHLDR